MFAREIETIIQYLEDKKNILITTHNMVDLDGFSSCFAFRNILNTLFKKKPVDIVLLDISKQTKEYMEKITKIFKDFDYSYKTIEQVDLRSFDVMVLLDTNDSTSIISKQEQGPNDLKIPKIVIDHHYLNEDLDKETPASLISDETTSTAELIFEFYNHLEIPLTIEMKYLLLSGILTDTGLFKYANNVSIIRVSKILEDLHQNAFQDIIELIKTDKEISEKIALIKGMQRVRLHRYNDWLIGISSVSSYEGIVASILIKNGFDVSIIYSEGKDESRISARATKKICSKTGLHLGKLMNEYVENLDANGGGHDGAAGLNGKFDAKEACNDLLNKIKDILNH